MKKTVISVILSIALLILMTACTGMVTPTPTPPADDGQPEVQTVYELLTSLSEKSYRSVKLSVVTTTDAATLGANYVLTNKSVTYSIEQLNKLSLDGVNSPEYKTTVTGSADIENGKVVRLDGNDVRIPYYSELKGEFIFDEKNFENVCIEDGYFAADVISSSEFYGADVSVSDLKVEVEYSDTALIKLTLRYNTENSSVVTAYEFK